MAAEHLRALIQRHRPGRSVRSLEEDAGVSAGRLAYWLKPSTQRTRMATLTQMQEMARIIRCDPGEVYEALWRDIDGSTQLTDGLADDERELLAIYRRLTALDRERLRQTAHVFHGERLPITPCGG